MSPSIPTDYEGLRRMGSEFLKAIPTLNADELDSGFACMGLAYLGCDFGASPMAEVHRTSSAPALMRLVARAVTQRQVELEHAEAAL